MNNYLCVGIGVYLCACAINTKTFGEANLWHIFKGLVFGIVCWPLALVFLYFMFNKGKADEI